MLERKPSAVAGYDGCLLRLAVDLGDRLLPAFDTASGVPLSWVHLQKVCCVATVSACQSTASKVCGLSQIAALTTHTTPELLYTTLYMPGRALCVMAAMPAKPHC